MPPLAMTLVVEGDSDEAVARRILTCLGVHAGPVYGKRGKGHIDTQLRRYNQAARHAAWLVLRDQDNDGECPGQLQRHLLSSPSRHMCFRIAVREVESWLMGDRKAFARFLGIPLRLVPLSPELESDPKHRVIALARQSRHTDMRKDIPPRWAHTTVGPLYTSRMIEFAQIWDPLVASLVCPSLARCLAAIRRMSPT